MDSKILKQNFYIPTSFARSGGHVIQRSEAALQGVPAKTGCDLNARRTVSEIRQHHEETPKAAATKIEPTILLVGQSHQEIGLTIKGRSHGIHLRHISGEKIER